MSNKEKKLDTKPGFTLVELIATIGIMGIVLVMAYSMGTFGSVTFNNGSAKSDIQSNIRIASNYITKELRYSSNATILPTFNTTQDLIDNYKYIYMENGILKQYNNVNGIGKGKITNITGHTSNNIITRLQFQIQSSETVDFNIQQTLRNQTFQLDSSVLLLNMSNQMLVNGTGPVISYTTEPIITNINAKPVQSITVSAPPTGSHNIPISGGTLQLKSTVKPDEAIQTVDWSVDDSKLAEIDTKGLLTTITNSAGMHIKVTATAQDHSGKVSEPYEVITVNPTVKFKFICNDKEYETGESISIKHKQDTEFTINVEPAGLAGILTAKDMNGKILTLTENNKFNINVDKNNTNYNVKVVLKIGSKTYEAEINFQT